jgi:hypothetical protein
MNLFSCSLLALYFFLVTVEKSSASHALGADLTYKCLGPGPTPGSYTYKFTYTFYRDCSGIPAPAAPDMVITNSCGYSVPTVNLIPAIGSPIQISPVCSTASSTCNGGVYLGIQEWIYEVTVTLPGLCHDWTFSHSESARNTAITTLAPGGSGNLFVYSILNNTGDSCIDSPVFLNRPAISLCTGQYFCFNNSTVSTPGDSLSFQLITPRTGPLPADTVSFLPGYSTTQPLISNPPMTFDSQTGIFCLSPTQPDVSVLSILTRVFRNGNLITQVERDLQIMATTCANTIPELTGINGFPGNSFTACRGKQNCFFISSFDPDVSDITSITWDHAIPGATLTSLGSSRDTAIFCWTPSATDTLSSPYIFTATVRDNSCPYNGLRVFTYYVTVDPDSTCIPLNTFSPSNKINSLKFFPNPVRNVAYIEIDKDFPFSENYELQVLNLLGEIVFRSTVSEKTFKLNLENLTPGLYFFRLINGQQHEFVCKKFVVME